MKLMLNNLFIPIVIFILGACTPPTPPTLPPDFSDQQREEERERVIQNLRDRYDGPTCDSLQGRNNDCDDSCNNIYSSSSDRRKCKDESIDLIEDLEEQVYNLLEDANEDDLPGIDSDLFDLYLRGGISGLDKLIKGYTSNESEAFLDVLLDDDSLNAVFEKRDDDFKMLENLLKNLESNYSASSNTWEVFDEDVGDANLIERLIDSNDDVVEWFMDFINEKNNACKGGSDNLSSRDCFEVYCKIGDQLHDDDKDDLLGFSEFEDYINDDIIDERVNSRDADENDDDKYNASGWRYGSDNRNNEIEDTDSFENNWVDELCHGLL